MLRCLLDHYVSIRASHPEGAYAGTAWCAFGFPFGKLRIHVESTVRQVEFRVRPLEMECRRKHSVANNVRRMNQSCNAGCDVQMPDIRLRCTHGTEVPVRGARSKDLRQRGQLDWVA